MITSDNQRSYDKRSDWASALHAAMHILFVLCPVYLAAILGPGPSLVVFWLWFGLCMHGLLNLMHECAHNHTFQQRSWCEFLGRWVLAPLVFADFDNYRQLHWDHHRHLGGDNDPKYSYRVNIGGKHFPLFLLQCLIGVEAVKKFAYQSRNRELKAVDRRHY